MTQEPIAIIGLGCRFPRAQDPEAYWDLLVGGVDAITEVPPDRWSVDHFYHHDIDAPGKMITKWGGFIDNPGGFDAAFFRVSATEAGRIDPQQRLVLEVAWEALEDACIAADGLAGTDAAVFMGVSHSDYERIIYHETAGIQAYDGPGAYHALTANRLSFTLNLKGPSMVVDTACSSSLSAIHVACGSLRAGECPIAITGGVNLNLTPEETIGLTKARMMSPRGRCATFDARADGYVRGEGVGVVILKRLADALRDGDRIRAVIRGSAITQNGAGNGVTAPNGPAQQAVVRRALSAGGLEPSQISYVEAHGTGTAIGDPIEMGALKSVLLPGRRPDQLCYIGSVKTNIGHLESASGMAGLIKVVLALEHAAIPAHLHFTSPNTYIDLGGTPFRIPTTLTPWPSAAPHFAGISAFGFGGTNAHVVVESGRVSAAPAIANPLTSNLFVLSARTATALRALTARFRDTLAKRSLTSVHDICSSVQVGRAQLEHRLAVSVDSMSALRLRLEEPDQASDGWMTGSVRRGRRLKIAYLFGQIAGGAGVDALHEHHPRFRALVNRARGRLGPGDAEWVPVDALVTLLREWGIEPALVLGERRRRSVTSALNDAATSNGRGPQGLSSADRWPTDGNGLVERLRQEGIDVVIEFGRALPRSQPPGGPTDRPCWISLPLDQFGVWERLLDLVGRLFVNGATMNWAGFTRERPFQKLALPTYPFERRRFWVEPYRPSVQNPPARLSPALTGQRQ